MQALRSSGSISDDMLIRRVSTRRRKSFMASPWQPAAKCWDCKPQPKADYLLPLLLLAANIILFFLSPSERLNMDFDAKDTLLPNGWSCIDQQEWWRFFTGLFMTGDPVLLAGNALLLLTVAPCSRLYSVEAGSCCSIFFAALSAPSRQGASFWHIFHKFAIYLYLYLPRRWGRPHSASSELRWFCPSGAPGKCRMLSGVCSSSCFFPSF